MRKRTWFALILLLPLWGCKQPGNRLNADKVLAYVDPFIGTDAHGHTFPGAAYPFGMVQLSPDTGVDGWDWCSGYHYSDSSIIGFSHTHLSGTGRADLLDVLLMPTTGEVKLNPGTKANPASGYRSSFKHDYEWASPGYYKVNLLDYDITAELTVSPRCGFHRYTFPASDLSHIILDLSHHFSTDSVQHTSLSMDGRLITGERRTRGWGEGSELYWSEQQLYFAIEFSKQPESVSLYKDDVKVDETNIEGKNVKAVVHYKTADKEHVLVKVGISAVSVANALENLRSEIPDWEFNDVLSKAQTAWVSELSKIKVEASCTEKRVYYTALYHSLIAPCLYNDVNGEYRGLDKKVHQTDGFTNYTVMSLWDTFRAQNPLLTLLTPDKVSDIIRSMLAQYDQSGLLPVWSLWSSETNCMIGYHSIPVIVDAYFKGIKGFDVRKAYEAMKTSAMQDPFGVAELKEHGYIPYDKYNKSVSTALEYCYDDWCIAQLAKALGETEDHLYFMNRAESYARYFDPQYKLMNGLSASGEHRRPFDPFYSSYGECDWVEGNSWQYSFFVPHDVKGLIALHGGDDPFVAALDTLFGMSSTMSGYDVPIDITGLIGQYAHGNEPSHHVAYLYNYAGRPDKAQERLYEINSTLYTDRPDGLCGNEDCGQMSAWYVFSALGFYPVNPADGRYIIGNPMVDRAELSLGSKPFEIKVNNRSAENRYIRSIRLNGSEYDKLYITHDDLKRGGVLEFTMGNTPNCMENAIRP